MADTLSGGRVVWDLDADASKLNKALHSARESAQKSGEAIQKSLNVTLSKSFKDAEDASKKFSFALGSIGFSIAGFLGTGVKIQGDLEAARQGFVALLGSAEDADNVMARIKQEAVATPFELKGLVEGTQALSAITRDGDKAIDILLDVGKAVSTSGKSATELDRIILNLQQIASTGTVTAMDIRQFQSAIPIFNDILGSIGMTTAELQDSETAADDLFRAFRTAAQEGGITSQGFAAQAGTFNQLWSNITDSVSTGLARIADESGAFDLVKEKMAELIKLIDNNIPRAIEIIDSFVYTIKDNGPIVAGILVGILAPSIIGFAASVGTATVALLPWVALFGSIGAAIQLIDPLIKNVKREVELFGELFNYYEPIIRQKIDTVVTKVTDMKDSFNELYEGVKTSLRNAYNTIDTTLTDIGKRIDTFVDEWFGSWDDWKNDFLPTLAVTLAQIHDALWDFLRDTFDSWNDGLGEWVGIIGQRLVEINSDFQDWLTDQVVIFDQWITNTLLAFDTWKSETTARIDQWITDTVVAIDQWVQDFPGRLDQWITNTVVKIDEWGRNTKESLNDGLNNMLLAFDEWWNSLGENPSANEAGEEIVNNTIIGIQKRATDFDTIVLVGKIIVGILLGSVALVGVGIIAIGFDIIKFIGKGIINANTYLREQFIKLVESAIRVIRETDWAAVGRNIINGIVSGIQSFGSNIGNSISSAVQSGVNSIKSILPGFADGVTNFGGGLAVVGEDGPEIVELPRGSNVISNRDMKSVAGNTFNVTMNNKIERESDISAIMRRMSFEAQVL